MIEYCDVTTRIHYSIGWDSCEMCYACPASPNEAEAIYNQVCGIVFAAVEPHFFIEEAREIATAAARAAEFRARNPFRRLI